MLGLCQPSRYTKMAVGWRKLYALVAICWNTQWGITAFRTYDLYCFSLLSSAFAFFLLPKPPVKLTSLYLQFFQSVDPTIKWSSHNLCHSQNQIIIFSSQCHWNPGIVYFLLEFLFIHSFPIALWFHVPPNSHCQFSFSLLLFSSLGQLYLYPQFL